MPLPAGLFRPDSMGKKGEPGTPGYAGSGDRVCLEIQAHRAFGSSGLNMCGWVSITPDVVVAKLNVEYLRAVLICLKDRKMYYVGKLGKRIGKIK